MKTKKERLSLILDLVRKHAFGNQEELLKLLHQSGFEVTQATLSRDIKYLKIIKSPDASGNYIYVSSAKNIYSKNKVSDKSGNELTIKGFISLEFSGNLGVIKTRPGYAMGIASDIDGKASHIILGTIAGDDTILIIPREGVEKKAIIEALEFINQQIN
ncbi:arginine repressor [Bacteroidia bacterium]|nr:arginine repressor [Bacteroidia bacterium]